MTIHLPFEILTAIFEEVDDVWDLWHARMASRTFCAAATPIAFRVLSVVSTRGSAQNLGRLLDVPDIAAYVRELGYHDTGADRGGRKLKYVRTSAVHKLASSFSRVHQLPLLEVVNLKFYPSYGNRIDSDDGGRLALQASILGALATSFNARAPPKLTSLSLQNLRTSDLAALESPSFQTVLTTLRRLQLSIIFDYSSDPDAVFDRWWHFWGTLCSRIVLAPTQHTLTELTLHSDTHVGASSGLSLGGLHFPRLCALSLRKLVFEPSVGAEHFILRHAATLTRLELLACKLPIDVYRFLSPSPSPSADLTKDGESRPTCWKRIWDRFAAELTALVSLHVDECRSDRWSRAVSDRPGPVPSFWEFCTPARRNVADATALQRFHMTVATRSAEASRTSDRAEGGA